MNANISRTDSVVLRYGNKTIVTINKHTNIAMYERHISKNVKIQAILNMNNPEESISTLYNAQQSTPHSFWSVLKNDYDNTIIAYDEQK